MRAMRFADARASRRLDAKQGGFQPTLVCAMPGLQQPTRTHVGQATTNFIWNSRYTREGSLTT